MAPFSRYWGLFVIKFEQKKFEDSKYYGERVLWFQRMCLRGQMIEGY